MHGRRALRGQLQLGQVPLGPARRVPELRLRRRRRQPQGAGQSGQLSGISRLLPLRAGVHVEDGVIGQGQIE